MIEYVSPNMPVVPRILPNQYLAKKFPMIEDGHRYVDDRSPPSTYVSPTLVPHQPLSPRTQLQQNHSSPYLSNNMDKARMKRGLYQEPLKDNSGDYLSNSYYQTGEYQYPSNHSDRTAMACFNQNSSNYWKATMIIYGIVIGLFSLTALVISIYLLARFSTITTV